jgi:hypothetical protein
MTADELLRSRTLCKTETPRSIRCDHAIGTPCLFTCGVAESRPWVPTWEGPAHISQRRAATPSSRALEVHRLHELARKVVIVLTMNFYHVQSMEVLQPTTHDHVNGLIFLFISS